ncbi:MAG TPA: enoyl-CoA hydratase-related protein [Streptosporangiaceae bacterium]|nr:enoyl-CoA hydratase-related protein [Streptosporangiaceae bacterium]
MPVSAERHGRILVITIAREDKRNALNADVTAGIDQAMNELEDNPELWCGILTGGRRFFSAGADLAAGPGEPTPRGGIAGLIQRDRAKPLIAAVEGFALGGGMELVLCCDLVVAASDARFGLPEVKRGLMPDFGGAFRAVRALPANIAREMLLTGDDLPAPRAAALGFVNRLTEPGAALEGALELAERVCANAPLAARAALRTSALVARGEEAALWAYSDAAHGRLLRSQDVTEGIAAFFERRDPNWQGR